MKTTIPSPPALDRDALRAAIRAEYEAVACEPQRGFHFHTGRPLARILGYDEALFEGIPERSLASFAGTGNPFSLGPLQSGERVVDVGSGAGLDSLIAARMVGSEGRIVGVDMTDAMLQRAEASRSESGLENVTFRKGFGEELPVPEGWADVVISNGVFNLMPDKLAAAREMARVLRPGGRLQIADILVEKPVSAKAKERIELWTG